MRWLLIAAMMLPAGLAGQTPTPPASRPLHVEGVGEPVTVGVASHRGYPAYPAWTLRAVGARVDNTAGGVRVTLGDQTLVFLAGSPFFHAGDQPHQLVDAAYREGGVVYLPHQLFAEWLPRHFADRLAFSGGRLALNQAASADSGGSSGGVAEAARTEQAAPAPAPGSAADSEPLGQPAQTPLIVIDAGHGGRDSGRVGPSGLKEKDIVLQVSKRLAKELSARGYEVRMTRTADTLIGLYDRAPMANEWRGNRPGIFLSIHANGVSDSRVRGFETFFLSEARTEDERRVAEMENSALEFESSTRVVASDDLGLIYNNLRNEFYIRASNTLAGLVQDEFTEFHSGHNRGVKQAGFVVLVGAFMPAVLIELAFISNPSEERLLGSGSFQVTAAEGIADAVDRFFTEQAELWTGASR